eukprot:CAMPEP_0118654916 /NCGR_PEP_ID=MMETSP0785-20121206/12644_1 /TAXON_ID=91992 /ORGANISM="Bolidomonas pacifica, Strain CCMP 1866" /LENGTH=327 /DNA_ID=CAMNT_0006547607 /DNA_START=122 /DNA_END=1102 /DNA_ORIENTATION=-
MSSSTAQSPLQPPLSSPLSALSPPSASETIPSPQPSPQVPDSTEIDSIPPPQPPLPLVDPIFQSQSFSTTSYGPSIQIAGKYVNIFGLYTFIVSVASAIPYYVGLKAVKAWLETKPEEERESYKDYDNVGKLWSKGWLASTFSYPTVINPHLLNTVSGGCLIVANHASWLDIPALCTVLDRPFKFIAKGELTAVPLIGLQLEGGNHVLITRDDRRSQLRTFKEATGYLRSGTPIMAFPEGGRTDDGRLGEFKNGVFSMAVKTGVPIIPVSICNANAVMPKDAMFPVMRGEGKLRIVIHDKVEVEGRKEEDISREVRERIKSALPKSQ